MIIEMLNCIFDILKEKSHIESIKTFEYFLNTLKNTIENVDCVNTDDEEFEEKDVVEVHKEIILKKLKSSIVNQHDGFVPAPPQPLNEPTHRPSPDQSINRPRAF